MEPATDEESALIEAVLDWIEDHGSATFDVGSSSDRLAAAGRAYRKTLKPQPFEGFIGVWDDGDFNSTVYDNIDVFEDRYHQLWRCTVTPVERVR